MHPFHEVLSFIHQTVRPRVYVEIGVANGESLCLALPETKAIGIDPAPSPLAPEIAPNGLVHVMTSDEYFEHTGPIPDLDLAFIDGMHNFDFALRDFNNLESRAHKETVILIHDVLPMNEETSGRAQQGGHWTGDVWRLMLILRTFRPDLNIDIVDVPPSGLGIVSGLDPNSPILEDCYDNLVERFLAVPYSAWDPSVFHPVGSTHEEIDAILEKRFAHA